MNSLWAGSLSTNSEIVMVRFNDKTTNRDSIFFLDEEHLTSSFAGSCWINESMLLIESGAVVIPMAEGSSRA